MTDVTQKVLDVKPQQEDNEDMINAAVTAAIEEFLVMANSHPSTPEHYGFEADRPGKKNTRIVMTRHGASRSAHAFVDNMSGDLFMAAGWKAPAHGARGNIVTGLDEVTERFYWSGGYLYNDSIKGWAKAKAEAAAAAV